MWNCAGFKSNKSRERACGFPAVLGAACHSLSNSMGRSLTSSYPKASALVMSWRLSCRLRRSNHRRHNRSRP